MPPPPARRNGNYPTTINWNKPTSKAGLEQLIPLVVTRLNQALPRFLAGQARPLIQAMLTEVQRTPKLLDCSPASLFGAVIQAGQLGLRLGPHLGECFIIPYSNKATLILGYRGLLQLAYRSGQVQRVTAKAVRDGDDFRFVRGTQQQLHHQPVRNNRGAVTDYYVVIELANGGSDFETMTREEALAHRDRYATTRNAPPAVRNQSPWYDETPGGGFDQMALKTCFRKLVKWMPVSVEVSTAVGLDEAAENELPQMLELQVAGLGEQPETQPEDPGPGGQHESPRQPGDDDYDDGDPLDPDDPVHRPAQ